PASGPALDQSELYDCERDPRQENNLFGDSSARALQEEHERRLTNWYIDTTGVPPRSGTRAAPRSSTALPSSSASRRWGASSITRGGAVSRSGRPLRSRRRRGSVVGEDAHLARFVLLRGQHPDVPQSAVLAHLVAEVLGAGAPARRQREAAVRDEPGEA